MAQYRLYIQPHTSELFFCFPITSDAGDPTCPLPSSDRFASLKGLSGGHRQRCDLAHHASEQPPRQMTLRLQQPVVMGVLNSAERWQLQSFRRGALEAQGYRPLSPSEKRTIPVRDHSSREQRTMRARMAESQPGRAPPALRRDEPLAD